MVLNQQRGAFPIELDRPRVIFYDMAATFLLFDRYGMGFATELYTAELAEDTKKVRIALTSGESLQYFLWAGLQAESRQHGETVTLEQAGEFIRPWLVTKIFTAVVNALTGAMNVPPVKVGNDQPAAPKSKPAAKKKRSTLKTRSGLRLHR